MYWNNNHGRCSFEKVLNFFLDISNPGTLMTGLSFYIQQFIERKILSDYKKAYLITREGR